MSFSKLTQKCIFITVIFLYIYKYLPAVVVIIGIRVVILVDDSTWKNKKLAQIDKICFVIFKLLRNTL